MKGSARVELTDLPALLGMRCEHEEPRITSCKFVLLEESTDMKRNQEIRRRELA